MTKRQAFNRSVLLLILLVVFSCKDDWSQPVETCSTSFADSSAIHPNRKLYQSILDSYVKKGLPGLVVLIRTPKDGLWIGASGKASIEEGEAMSPCHIQNSGSVMKMYMATAVMLLYEEGKIDLDANINTYLEKEICNNIRNGNEATVRQLMNHTSGIADITENYKMMAYYYNAPMSSYSTGEYLRNIYGLKPYFKPGLGVQYSNTNFLLLALIVDSITGKSHADFITERIIKKLGLKDTYYKNEMGYPAPNGLVNSYFDRYSDGKLENVTAIANNLNNVSEGYNGLLASTYDYALFIEALFKEKIVNGQSLKKMTQWNFVPQSSTFGLGLFHEQTKYGVASVGHNGANMGGTIMVKYYSVADITIVMSTNVGGLLQSPLKSLFLTDLNESIEKVVFEENGK